ncbi:UNKNOWN [Stylonychia lemnae]|uniref:Lipid-binding serum glycoprotein C-terminal domain-containing protein n=1 Tax=Stylonychia lemnae TaxID=5949 RepID=A0A077ZNA0_STYLE|nr:UNKNOWN [Stylonychia lemnae]|eukprot:CDW71462.1 UNKNOWN [Stylonychia lemnae]
MKLPNHSISLVLTLLIATLAPLAQSSDVQAYPGVQLRIEQDFLDMVSKELFEVLPVIVDKIDNLLPKELNILILHFSEIELKDFQIDPARGKFKIDAKESGIKMNWAKLVNYQFHCHVKIPIWWFIQINWDIDIYLKNVTVDNGISLTSYAHSGAPYVDLYQTKINLGDSYYRMSGNFIMYLISWITNLLLKYPLQVLIDLFLQPGINFFINNFLIPGTLHNGYIELQGFHTSGTNATTSLMLDLTLPQTPVYTDTSIDTFDDGAVYFKNHNETFTKPNTPMKFQTNDFSLQLVASSFSVNQIVETVLETGLIAIPIDHSQIKNLIGIDLTTTIMLVIVPELFYHYGSKSVNLKFTPISGTNLDFSQSNSTVDSYLQILADFIIVEADNSTQLAFQALMGIEADIDLQIEDNVNKTVDFQFKDLELKSFNVTVDNCYVKNDEDNIKTRLNAIMAAIELSVNQFVKALGPKLPQFQTFDYNLHFDYQDHAFGTGISIKPKGQ